MTGALRDVLARIGVFGGVWLVLVDLDLGSPVVACASVLAAVAADVALSPRRRWQWRAIGALRFIPHFVRASLAGGADVALRAFRPSLPLAPGLMTFRTRLGQDSTAATFFLAVVSLLPGTLCAEVEGPELTIHRIDRQRDDGAQLRALEERVAAIFGASLGDAGEEAR